MDVSIPPIAGPNAVPADDDNVTAPIHDPLLSAGRYDDTIASDMDIDIPAPRPCTPLSMIMDINPSSGISPHIPMARDDIVNIVIPMMNTFLYPMLEPILDHNRMKQHSMSV